MICPDCSGKGWFWHQHSEPSACETCDGQGSVADRCLGCDKELSTFDPDGEDWPRCWACEQEPFCHDCLDERSHCVDCRTEYKECEAKQRRLEANPRQVMTPPPMPEGGP